jgi:hypothetical protein
VFLERNKSLFIVISLLATTVASAAPTIATDNTIAPIVQTELDTPAVIVPAEEVFEHINDKLANLGAEFLQPPRSFAVLGNIQDNDVKPLPAVPAALFMVLCGFLCVSLVKDRKIWLAALAGLLWAVQIGIQTFPQLALHLSRRNHSQQQFSTKLIYPYYLENSNRLRSDIEGEQYIGLLHHLAGIPDRPTLFLQPRPSFLRKQEFRKVTTPLYRLSNPSKNTDSFQSQSAFLSEEYSLNSLFNCLASKVEQLICFSPAFIFANLTRGPPIPA